MLVSKHCAINFQLSRNRLNVLRFTRTSFVWRSLKRSAHAYLHFVKRSTTWLSPFRQRWHFEWSPTSSLEKPNVKRPFYWEKILLGKPERQPALKMVNNMLLMTKNTTEHNTTDAKNTTEPIHCTHNNSSILSSFALLVCSNQVSAPTHKQNTHTQNSMRNKVS